MSDPSFKQDRRRFIAGVAVAGGATALTSLSAVSEPAESTSDSLPANSPEAESRGYQMTEHVRAYYRACRI